jgi:hypothetical protein
MFFNKSVFPPPEQWRELYGNITEDVPPSLLVLLSVPMYFTAYVDANHASHKVMW